VEARARAGGEIVRGEGVIGLTHAFFEAGATSVIAGLWPLRDRETAKLMDAFYGQLTAGTSVGGALAAAKREMIEAGEPTSAWAGLVVFGDGGATIPLRKSWISGVHRAIVLGASLATLTIVLYWRRRTS